jgi:putative ABC transport system permease protein
MRALDHKLWRDLWHLRGQSIAITAVTASGVACFLMFMSTLDSLLLSRDLYYTDYRFADVFVPSNAHPNRSPGALPLSTVSIKSIPAWSRC